MTTSALQEVIDRAAVTSGQRWALAAGAVAAALTASVLAAVAAGGTSPVLPIIVVAMSIAAVIRADSHVALAAAGLVFTQWTFGVDDLTTPLAMPAALALFMFHAVVALLAVTPPTVTVDAAVLARWGRRSLIVAAATCWTWLTAAMLAGQNTAGSVALTAMALLALAALLVAARTHGDT